MSLPARAVFCRLRGELRFAQNRQVLQTVAGWTKERLVVQLDTEKPFAKLPALVSTLAQYYDCLSACNVRLNATVLFRIDDAVPRPLSTQLGAFDLYVNTNDAQTSAIKAWHQSQRLPEPVFRQLDECAVDANADNAPSATSADDATSTLERYNHVAVGGTFDHLHAGHKLLLSASVAVARQRLTVGLTDASMVAHKKFAEFMQSYEAREAGVRAFVANLNPTLEVSIVRLTDALGPAATDATIDALIVSAETASGVDAANAARHANKLAPLVGVSVPLVDGGQKEKVSSTMLRQLAATDGANSRL